MRRIVVAALALLVASCGSSDKPLTAADKAACARALSYLSAYEHEGNGPNPSAAQVMLGPTYGLPDGDPVRNAVTEVASALATGQDLSGKAAGLRSTCGKAAE